MANIENRVETLLKNKIEEIGYELYDVEYAKEGKNYFLRIFIDSINGINLEDCEKVSNEINDMLDEANIISDQYFLEVSSPGIEKILRKDKHVEGNIGKEVEIKLFKKDENGKKEYKGKIKTFDEQKIKIETQNQEIEINRKDIAQIKTVYNWEE
ncbi:MAG: ribosome maturation factor RimP [Clostridia bacterium]|nr:ribosome maturation factor RimP [Clostridia bacterium]